MNQNFKFTAFSQENISTFLSTREHELKIGQYIIQNKNKAKFVILGIEESIGPQANYGQAGAENAFDAFLTRFLNMQANRFITCKDFQIIGKISAQTNFQNIDQARKLVEELDEMVIKILQPYINENVIPIVIGGGHNNAFPLIKASFLKDQKKLSVINLDPHADCRALEGRHSGNSFSYAMKEGFIEKYTVLGLHKAYNSEFLLKFLDENNCEYSFFDDYITNPTHLYSDISKYSDQLLKAGKIGIELDLDAIKNMPSSALSPSGISVEDARFYIQSLAKIKTIQYLHLPEAAPKSKEEQLICGKTLAYLVHDFIVNY